MKKSYPKKKKKKNREEAEQYYARGDYYCSEAIVASIRNNIAPEMPEEAIAMASGFPVGIGGAKCVCGAMSGGVLCLGYFFGRTKQQDTKINKVMELSKELHDNFIKDHKVLCCKMHTKKLELGSEQHMKQCIQFTGEVAENTARIISRELKLELV